MLPDSRFDSLLDAVIDRVGPRLVVGLPLGLGKPNRLINALYRRACTDRDLDVEFVTALSLDPPRPGHWLEARLMELPAQHPRTLWLKAKAQELKKDGALAQWDGTHRWAKS